MADAPLRADTASPHLPRAWLIVLGIAGGALIAGTVALWAHYGGAVFYEAILAGLAACF